MNNKNSDKRILFFLNRGSGQGIGPELEKEILELSRKERFTYRISEITGGKDRERIGREIDEFSPHTVVAAGGDGTVNLVAGQLLDKEVLMGIIPFGSANGMAYEMQIPTDPIEALRLIPHGIMRNVDVIKVNDDNICLHISDLGVNARVVKRFEKEGERGLLGYARQYFKELGRIKKFSYYIETDQETYRSNAIMLVVANAAHYGTGAVINPGGHSGDGKFEIIVVKAFPFWFFLNMLYTFVTGRKEGVSLINSISCKEARVITNPPQPLQVDGEVIETPKELILKLLPGKIKMIGGNSG